MKAFRTKTGTTEDRGDWDFPIWIKKIFKLTDENESKE